MDEGGWTVRKATPSKSMGVVWADGSPVQIQFYERGARKSQVTIQHGCLSSKAEADRLRAFWGERLEALVRALAK